METTVKERPWVAKQHEAQAIAAGRKTQLRILAPVFEGKDLDKLLALHPNQHGCPLGEVGGRLWVREPWFAMRYDWKELGSGAPILYSDGFIREREAWGQTYEGKVPPVGHAWKGAVTMPRAASRLLLEITAVRVERVQGISETDAVAEGIGRWMENAFENYEGGAWWAGEGAAQRSYQSLWASINGPESWAANPWVWVVEFNVISPATPTKEGGRHAL